MACLSHGGGCWEDHIVGSCALVAASAALTGPPADQQPGHTWPPHTVCTARVEPRLTIGWNCALRGPGRGWTET